MAEVVRMPKLSDTMTDGVIAKWHKKVGDKVKSGEVLADIETDKATMEFESFQDGVLLHIGVPEKQPVPVDSVIAILGKPGEDISGLLNGGGKATEQPKKAEEKAPAPQAQQAAAKKLPEGVEIVRMPKLSDTMSEGVVAKWHKKVGDKVKSGELLADIQTDKATMEFESFQDGVILYIGVQEGKGAPVDSILAILGKGGEDVNAIIEAEKKSVQSSTPIAIGTESSKVENPKEGKTVGNGPLAKTGVKKESVTSNNGERMKISPLAKKLAEDKGIS